MIFLFRRWDMLIPWRVLFGQLLTHERHEELDVTGRFFAKKSLPGTVAPGHVQGLENNVGDSQWSQNSSPNRSVTNYTLHGPKNTIGDEIFFLTTQLHIGPGPHLQIRQPDPALCS